MFAISIAYVQRITRSWHQPQAAGTLWCVGFVVRHGCDCRQWCKIGSDPKDAEDFVEEACKDGRIMPNAATVNSLNKLWDTHDQLHI